MRALWTAVRLCLGLMLPLSVSPSMMITEAAPPPKPVPSYAKWSRLAIKEAKKQYPTAQIKDFLYLGRAKQGRDKTAERFKLWVQNQNKEFGLLVTVVFDRNTEKVQSISFIETPN
jgi:hypothetical protein